MKLKSKKILIFSLILVGVLAYLIVINYSLKGKNDNTSKQRENFSDNKSYINEDEKQIYNEIYTPFLAVDYSKIDNLNKEANYIAIIRIDSLESSNWDAINNQYVSVYSKGEATVLKVLKGSLSSSISYKRLGGQIEYNEWIKGDVDKEKIENVIGNFSNTDNIIINSQKEGDIKLEVGKTYLVFMRQYSCCNSLNEYTIIGYEYGTRKLQQNEFDTLSTEEFKSLKVKDNKTGEWIRLQDIVNLDELK